MAKIRLGNIHFSKVSCIATQIDIPQLMKRHLVDMDWDLLEQRKVRPPFRPRVRSARDAVNFDTEFTREEPVLTPVPNDIVRCINQDEFSGFSFTNKEFGPERKICC